MKLFSRHAPYAMHAQGSVPRCRNTAGAEHRPSLLPKVGQTKVSIAISHARKGFTAQLASCDTLHCIHMLSVLQL